MGVLIIAEAGVNHNGEIALGKQLIDVAKEAGADLIKFQTFSPEQLVTPSACKAKYQDDSIGASETQLSMLKRLQLTHEMHCELISHSELRGIKFFSTAFDIKNIDYLVSLGQTLFKIPSGEITNLPYLRHIGQFGYNTLVSTGMATLGEVETAIEILEKSGTPRPKITILHCTTEYPTPMEDVNLRAIQTLKNAFGVRVGYSDHTRGIEIAIAAVAMGATVIEKHLTLDRSLPGPDHKASLEPTELKEMVCAIRNLELAFGDGIKRLMPSEEKNRTVARKSIFAKCIIKKGELFTCDNLTVKRPGNGISPLLWDEIIGRKAAYNFEPDEFIYF